MQPHSPPQVRKKSFAVALPSKLYKKSHLLHLLGPNQFFFAWVAERVDRRMWVKPGSCKAREAQQPGQGFLPSPLPPSVVAGTLTPFNGPPPSMKGSPRRGTRNTSLLASQPRGSLFARTALFRCCYRADGNSEREVLDGGYLS